MSTCCKIMINFVGFPFVDGSTMDILGQEDLVGLCHTRPNLDGEWKMSADASV
jgi:hypothetical protein